MSSSSYTTPDAIRFGIPEEKDDKLVKTRVHWIRIPSLLILYKYKLHL